MKKTKEPEFCEAFGRCGACQTLNMDYEEELSLKMRNISAKAIGSDAHSS